MENIGGIFVVLICGLIIAVFVAVMEFIWSTRRSAESEEVRRLAEWGQGEKDPRPETCEGCGTGSQSQQTVGIWRGGRHARGRRNLGSQEVRGLLGQQKSQER